MANGIAVLSAAALLALVSANPPYYGLDKHSYGNLVNYRDQDTHESLTPPLCNPQATYSDVNELARRITGFITRPLQRFSKVDDTIKQEDLQSFFLIPGDPGGVPPVALIDRDTHEINFWYVADLVTLKEVSNAAGAYCKHVANVDAIYAGSARKCDDPKQAPVIVNGQQTIIQTFAISSFHCGEIPADAAKPAKSTHPRRRKPATNG